MSSNVVEIVKWKSKDGVDDKNMILAVDKMLPDLKKLPGFIHQSLYKNKNNEWVDVYFWETEDEAHNSNSLMENKESLKNLLDLIDLDSVTMEIYTSLQASGKIS